MNLDQSIQEAQTPAEKRPVDELLSFLTTRLEVAKANTKGFIEEVQKCLDDYEAKETGNTQLDKLDINRRYEFVIPYIFATHESMLSSIFEKAPDLIISGRGAKDEDKARKIKAVYEYLWDKIDLDSFMTNSAWWFILIGLTSCDIRFKSEFREVQAIDPQTMEPMYEEDGVTPIMTVVYDFNDPEVWVDDPTKVYWSPDSVYSIEADRVPYYFREKNMDVDDIEDIYGIKVEPSEEIDIDNLDANDDDKRKKYKDETNRSKTYHYYGNVPKKYQSIVDEELGEGTWEINREFYLCFTMSKVLHIEKRPPRQKQTRVARWYGKPHKFFGFGIGKTLRQFQKELSIRRGQQIRYADVAAYAKIALEASSTTDPKSLKDPRENVVITYTDKPPSYLVPPDLSNTLVATEQKAREDAQFVSGLLDLSNGAQESRTVKTATGQTIFAEGAEKRIKKARKELGKYLRSVVIQLLKLCAQYWDEEKVMTITDEDGEEIDLEVTREDLADIDFDNDIDIDLESISVNKDVMREQVIALYDKTKDDPLVERRKIFRMLLRDGFSVRNPDSYIKEVELTPGAQLIDQTTGEIYVVGEDGELSKQEVQEELAEPGMGGSDLASTPEGVMNSVQP